MTKRILLVSCILGTLCLIGQADEIADLDSAVGESARQNESQKPAAKQTEKNLTPPVDLFEPIMPIRTQSKQSKPQPPKSPVQPAVKPEPKSEAISTKQAETELLQVPIGPARARQSASLRPPLPPDPESRQYKNTTVPRRRGAPLRHPTGLQEFKPQGDPMKLLRGWNPQTPARRQAASSSISTPVTVAPPRPIQPWQPTKQPKSAAGELTWTPGHDNKSLPPKRELTIKTAKPALPILGKQIIVVVDRSASMVGHWQWLISDLDSTISHLNPSHRLSLWYANDKGKLLATPQALPQRADATTIEQARNTLATLQPSGLTDVASALQGAIQTLTRSGATAPCVYLLSNGLPANPSAVLDVIQTNGRRVPVHTFFFGSQYPKAIALMKQIATNTGGQFSNVTKR